MKSIGGMSPLANVVTTKVSFRDFEVVIDASLLAIESNYPKTTVDEEST